MNTRNINLMNIGNTLSHENKDREMLKSIDFPIELRPCYYTLPGTRKRRIMKNKKVLIRKDTGEPISIVSEGYYPLAHLKAIETGKEIYSHLLGGYPKNEIRILKLYHSPGGEVCNALLVPKNSELIHSFQKKEWIPMLWVKNSYNKTESFSILFGWMRLACLNGMIMNEKEEFKIKFLHKKSRFMLDVGMIIQTLQQQDVLRESRDKLYGFVHHLKNMEINPDKALALACKMLGLKFWAKKHEALEGRELYHVIRKSPDYMHFSQLFRPIAHAYFRELGYNAYALLNILTDLISHHGTEIKKLKNFSSRADYFYTLPAAEMKSFVNLAQNPGFSLENYLGKYKLIL